MTRLIFTYSKHRQCLLSQKGLAFILLNKVTKCFLVWSEIEQLYLTDEIQLQNITRHIEFVEQVFYLQSK